MPRSRASSTASDDGAPTATSIGQPATAAFCTSSNESRPLTQSTCSRERQQPLAERPADDLVERVVPADVLAQAEQRAVARRRGPVACRPPVAANAACAARKASGQRGDELAATRRSPLDARRLDGDRLERALAADAAGGRRVEAAREPRRVEPRRVELDRVRGEVVREPRARRRAALPRGAKPSASSSSWPGVRIVTATGRAVDPDLERLLDRDDVRSVVAVRDADDVDARRQ